MTLEVFVPSEVHSFYDIRLVDVESVSGRMTFLPRHVDSAAALVPGLVRFEGPDGDEHFLGSDGGTVVKIGDRVMISTPRAVVGVALGELHDELVRRHRERTERDRRAQQAFTRMATELARSIFGREESG